MFQPVIRNLIEVAKTSTMTSRHAAAIVSGKRLLASATNYSLPAGELVDAAAASSKSRRGGPGNNVGHFACNRKNSRSPHCSSASYTHCSPGRTTTPFESLYQRYQVFEGTQCRVQEQEETRDTSSRAGRLRLIQQIRCEKGCSSKEGDSTYEFIIVLSCRGECLDQI